jgi:hypothetical protein
VPGAQGGKRGVLGGWSPLHGGSGAAPLKKKFYFFRADIFSPGQHISDIFPGPHDIRWFSAHGFCRWFSISG